MDTKVSISTEFLESLVKLPKNIQEKVVNFFQKFIDNPYSPGINLEKITTINGKQIHSVRIDLAYRGIGYKDIETNIFHLLWVKHHDESYKDAERKRYLKIDNISVIDRNYYERIGITKINLPKLLNLVSYEEIIQFGDEYLLPVIGEFNGLELLPDITDSKNNLYKNELITTLKKKVLIPGLEHPGLDQDVKESIKNTIDRIEIKNSVFSVIDFFNDALMSNDGKYIREKLNENGLLAFEDIEPEVRDFISKM